MAAFTTLGLIGLGLAGGAAASRLASRRRNPAQIEEAASDRGIAGSATPQPATAPPPSSLAAPAPPDTRAAASQAIQFASAASRRQRRRAASGAQSSRAVPSGAVAGLSLQPRTLLGA